MPDIGEDDADAGYQPSVPGAAKSVVPMPPVRPAGIGEDDADASKPPINAPADTAPTPVYSGSILPMTRYSDGTINYFDPNAGILGKAQQAAKGIWSGFTYPGDVAQGNATADPRDPAAIRRAMDMATIAAPDAAVATARSVIAPPTALELKSAGGAGYDAVRNMGVDYSIPHVADRAAQVQQILNDKGFTSRVAPDVHATLNDLQSAPSDGVAVPISLLDNARREFGQMAGNFSNKPQQAAAKQAQNAIDDFIANPPPGSVLAGPADQAAQTLKDARANYAAGSRSDIINQRGDYAEYKANDSNSGQNLPNNLRKQASWFLDPMHPERRAGFNSDELAALDQVNRGSFGTNSARTVGHFFGSGKGGIAGAESFLSGLGGYGEFGLPGLAIGAVPPIAGTAAKALEKRWTQQQFDAADELVRQRSPLYREQAAAAPLQTGAAAGPTAASRSAVPAAASTAPSDIAPPASAPSPNSPAQPLPKAKKNAPFPPAMTPSEAADYVQQHQGETFARGGSVKRKRTHEELVQRLMDASEKAKAATKRETKAILAVPDNTVAKALEVAQKAI